MNRFRTRVPRGAPRASLPARLCRELTKALAGGRRVLLLAALSLQACDGKGLSSAFLAKECVTKADCGPTEVCSARRCQREPEPQPQPTPPGVTLAFPGAEGGGAMSVGGRGGRVYRVNTIEDGAGLGGGKVTLRECLLAAGPRTCVFAVSGIIYLKEPLSLGAGASYLTVAGQTAPGGGIAIAGGSGDASTTFGIMGNLINIGGAHDVVWRYVRLWRGYTEAARQDALSHGQGGCGSSLAIHAAQNAIFDHLTSSWAMGHAIVATGGGAEDIKNLTVSHSILAEGIGDPCVGWGAALGGGSFGSADTATDVDFHHNYLANLKRYIPLLMVKSSRVVNNIVFNWHQTATGVGGGAWADLIGNYFQRGPSSDYLAMVPRPISINKFDRAPSCTGCGPHGTPSVYLANNVDTVLQPSVGSNDWDALAAYVDIDGGGQCGDGDAAPTCANTSDPRYHPVWIPDGRPPKNINWKRAAPLASATAATADPEVVEQRDTGIPITAVTLTGGGRNLLEALLPATAAAPLGASRRLDCAGQWVVNRDPSDQRLVDYVLVSAAGAKAQQLRVTDYNPGGFPSLSPVVNATAVCPALQADNSACSCLDTDADGMPDLWERARGLDPNDDADGSTVGDNGYTNLENYLNGQ